MPEFGRRGRAQARAADLVPAPPRTADPETPELSWRPPPPRPLDTKFLTWWPLTLGFVVVTVVLVVYVPSTIRIIGLQGLIPVGVIGAITLVLLALLVSRTLIWLQAGGLRQLRAPPPPEPGADPNAEAGADAALALAPVAGLETVRSARVSARADGGAAFEFPPSRESAGLLTAVLVLSLGLLALFVSVVPVHSRGMTLLTLAWGVVEYTLLIALLRLCFVTDRVVIGADGISVTAGLLGDTRTMAPATVRAIYAASGLMTLHHAIRIRGTGWRRITVGDGIRDWREAELLAAVMSRLAGVAETPSRAPPRT
jgi:hypothetical protein